MAYNATHMRLMGGVPGQQLFLYRSEDESAEVIAEGYFDPAVEHYNLTEGDVVLAVTGFGTANGLGAYVVSVAEGSASLTALA
ncbi:MAG: hypothetical protein AB7D51_00350 [Desulfovibrionaceae bacterium]